MAQMKKMSGKLDTIVCQDCAMWMFTDHAFTHNIECCPFCKGKNVKVKP